MHETEFSSWLGEHLQMAHLSDESLADRAGVPLSTIRSWLQNGTLPSRDECMLLANALNEPEEHVFDVAGYWDRRY